MVVVTYIYVQLGCSSYSECCWFGACAGCSFCASHLYTCISSLTPLPIRAVSPQLAAQLEEMCDVNWGIPDPAHVTCNIGEISFPSTAVLDSACEWGAGSAIPPMPIPRYKMAMWEAVYPTLEFHVYWLQHLFDYSMAGNRNSKKGGLTPHVPKSGGENCRQSCWAGMFFISQWISEEKRGYQKW